MNHLEKQETNYRLLCLYKQGFKELCPNAPAEKIAWMAETAMRYDIEYQPTTTQIQSVSIYKRKFTQAGEGDGLLNH